MMFCIFLLACIIPKIILSTAPAPQVEFGMKFYFFLIFWYEYYSVFTSKKHFTFHLNILMEDVPAEQPYQVKFVLFRNSSYLCISVISNFYMSEKSWCWIYYFVRKMSEQIGVQFKFSFQKFIVVEGIFLPRCKQQK